MCQRPPLAAGLWRRLAAALLGALVLHCTCAVELCGEQLPRPLLAAAARLAGGAGSSAVAATNSPKPGQPCSSLPVGLSVHVSDDGVDAWCDGAEQLATPRRDGDTDNARVPVALVPVVPVVHLPQGGGSGSSSSLPPTNSASSPHLLVAPGLARALFLDASVAFWDDPALVSLNPLLLQHVGHVPVVLFGLAVSVGGAPAPLLARARDLGFDTQIFFFLRQF